jgi:hypothetical protein
MSLNFFSQPTQLSRIQRDMFTRLLEGRKGCLPRAAVALLTAQLDFEQFCEAWAALFKSPEGFRAPVLEALGAIEALSLPENAPLFEKAVATLPPGYTCSPTFPPLQRCLNLWIICENTPGVSWPLPLRVQPSMCFLRCSSSALPEMPCPLLKAGNGELQIAPEAASSTVQVSAAAPIPQSGPATPHSEGLPGSHTPDASKAADDFARLARLSASEYDRVRHAEAKRLGLRLRTLDEEVEGVRTVQADAEANEVNLSKIEPWPEPIADAPALFEEVHGRFLLHLHMPPGAAVALTLWPPHAHAINAFSRTPRLNFTSSEPGCGKTTCLELLSTLCPNFLCTNSLKPAVLYRILHKGQVTVALDELDLYVQLYPELRALLNAGNNPSACVHRCEGRVVRAFKLFAPIALAGLGQLTPTLRDRSIIIEFSKAPAGALQARFDPEHAEVEKVLGRKIARWARDNFDRLAALDPVMPAAAYNRLGDNWRPLFAIAQTIGGAWPERVVEAFSALAGPKRDEGRASESPGKGDNLQLLLKDIRSIFTQCKATRLFSSTLVEYLRAMPDRPWSGNQIEQEGTEGTEEKEAINQTWLARQLRPLGIRPRNLRIGNMRAKGYELADFSGVQT